MGGLYCSYDALAWIRSKARSKWPHPTAQPDPRRRAVQKHRTARHAAMRRAVGHRLTTPRVPDPRRADGAACRTRVGRGGRAWRVQGATPRRPPDPRRMWALLALDRPAHGALRDPERIGRPVVEPLEPGHDDADVEEVPEAVLGDDVRLDVLAEWVVVGQDARQGQEDAGHSETRISQRPTERCQPPEGESRLGDECVGVEHPDEHQIDEESLDAALVARQLLVPEIRRDDGGVVRAIPGSCRRLLDEVEGGRHPWSARATRAAEGECRRLADVAKQELVQCAPPGTAGRRRRRGIQQPPPQLPSHERRGRPPVGQVAAIDLRRQPVQLAEEGQPCVGKVAHARHPFVGVRRGRGFRHPSILTGRAARRRQRAAAVLHPEAVLALSMLLERKRDRDIEHPDGGRTVTLTKLWLAQPTLVTCFGVVGRRRKDAWRSSRRQPRTVHESRVRTCPAGRCVRHAAQVHCPPRPAAPRWHVRLPARRGCVARWPAGTSTSTS